MQCKWAGRHDDVLHIPLRTSPHTPRGYVRTTYGAREVDGIAAYCRELDRCFYLPIEEFEHRTSASLRLAPARNGPARRC